MYIQLYEIKKHLNIDKDFHDDDEYLMSLEEVAEKVVETNIDTQYGKVTISNQKNQEKIYRTLNIDKGHESATCINEKHNNTLVVIL